MWCPGSLPGRCSPHVPRLCPYHSGLDSIPTWSPLLHVVPTHLHLSLCSCTIKLEKKTKNKKSIFEKLFQMKLCVRVFYISLCISCLCIFFT